MRVLHELQEREVYNFQLSKNQAMLLLEILQDKAISGNMFDRELYLKISNQKEFQRFLYNGLRIKGSDGTIYSNDCFLHALELRLETMLNGSVAEYVKVKKEYFK